MNVLHTSDWHLGASLYGRKRYDEFDSFLNWLLQKIKETKTDLLIVSGDIFDKSVPSNRAQELYYRFLVKVAAQGCRHVVIVAGNHDSPTFLDAPRGLLGALNVYVIGSAKENPADEVLTLLDSKGKVESIICAVPYLRDRDLRKVEAGESSQDKEEKLIEGICHHYQVVCDKALKIQTELDTSVPILATGHLFTTGAKTVEGDGVRELYVGSLARVTGGAFPKCIDYLALGHLHVPQKVGEDRSMRYSGSPYPIGFGEAKQEKIVISVQFMDGETIIKSISVPRFQELEQISGDWDSIYQRIAQLKNELSDAWLEIIYNGEEMIPDLADRLDACLSDSQMELLRVKNKRVIEQIMNRSHNCETLDDLEVSDVFERCLESHELPEHQRQQLIDVFNEAVLLVQQDHSTGDEL